MGEKKRFLLRISPELWDELNRWAAAQMTCENALRVVPGATHLFEERGALAAVATLAGDWFVQHMKGEAHA